MEMIDFAHDMLEVAVRAVSVFGLSSAAICGLWVAGSGHAVSCSRAVG